MAKNSLSNIKAHDIFFARKRDNFGDKVGHYFYCIYSQNEDSNNVLFRDIIALMISSKEQRGYNTQILLNERPAYVLCDTIYRFDLTKEMVEKKEFNLSEQDKKNVLSCFNEVSDEALRQLKKGE